MLVSDVLGNLSQLFWLFAQLPQIWTNYRNRSVEGLSLPFLLNWLIGDVTNLIGCLLTHQLVFQRNLAIYFNLIDLVLIGQFVIYSRVVLLPPTPSPESIDSHPYTPISEGFDDLPIDIETDLRNTKLSSNPHSPSVPSSKSTSPQSGSQLHQATDWNEHSSNPSTRYSCCWRWRRAWNLKTGWLFLLAVFGLIVFQILSQTSSSVSYYRNHQSLLGQGFLSDRSGSSSFGVDDDRFSDPIRAKVVDEEELDGRGSMKQRIGRLSAWLCACLYLSSRIPQIIKNYRRKSVEGLSMLLFVFAFFGNLTYVLSILSSPVDPLELESIAYLIGSAGTLCFDLMIFVQSRLYRQSST